jgi:hypothetical protein
MFLIKNPSLSSPILVAVFLISSCRAVSASKSSSANDIFHTKEVFELSCLLKIHLKFYVIMITNDYLFRVLVILLFILYSSL